METSTTVQRYVSSTSKDTENFFPELLVHLLNAIIDFSEGSTIWQWNGTSDSCRSFHARSPLPDVLKQRSPKNRLLH